MSIHDIRSWAPGAFMLYDSRKAAREQGVPQRAHVGLGMVVANDGISLIRVIWGANCRGTYLEYEVSQLNPQVIFHVG